MGSMVEQSKCRAHLELTQHLAIENTADIAASVVAELYTAAYMGMNIRTQPNENRYDWTIPVRGGWSVCRNDGIANRLIQVCYKCFVILFAPILLLVGEFV